MTKISFISKPYKLGTKVIVRVPKSMSDKLPSRGLVLIQGALNEKVFQVDLEPDGRGGHWFELSKSLRGSIGLKEGGSVRVSAETMGEWPEPELPNDLKMALAKDKVATDTWKSATAKAHWDWIRWVRANNAETRARKVEVALAKLRAGEKRPCCFNYSVCTVPEVSKNGQLIEA